ncbi:MAG TPA: hypothetical protein VGF48_23575 [Thermoanaerobaculia bacterium]
MESAAMTRKLYDALFQITTLRDEVHALSAEMASIDQSRFLLHLELLEATAVRLVDESEQHLRVSSH